MPLFDVISKMFSTGAVNAVTKPDTSASTTGNIIVNRGGSGGRGGGGSSKGGGSGGRGSPSRGGVSKAASKASSAVGRAVAKVGGLLGSLNARASVCSVSAQGMSKSVTSSIGKAVGKAAAHAKAAAKSISHSRVGRAVSRHARAAGRTVTKSARSVGHAVAKGAVGRTVSRGARAVSRAVSRATARVARAWSNRVSVGRSQCPCSCQAKKKTSTGQVKSKQVSIAKGKTCSRLQRLHRTNQSAARKFRERLIRHYGEWYNNTVKTGYNFVDDLYQRNIVDYSNDVTTTTTTETDTVTEENFTDVRVQDWVKSPHFAQTVQSAVQKKSQNLVRTISKLREQIQETERLYQEKKEARRSRGRSYSGGRGSDSPRRSAHRCSMRGAVKSIVRSFADHPEGPSRRSIVSAAKTEFNQALCQMELSQSACQRLAGGSRRRSGSRKRSVSRKRRSGSRNRRSGSRRRSVRRSLRRSVRKSCGRKRSASRKRSVSRKRSGSRKASCGRKRSVSRKHSCGRKRSVSRKCAKQQKYYYDYSADCNGGQYYQYQPSQVAQVQPTLHSVPAVQLAATVNAKK